MSATKTNHQVPGLTDMFFDGATGRMRYSNPDRDAKYEGMGGAQNPESLTPAAKDEIDLDNLFGPEMQRYSPQG